MVLQNGRLTFISSPDVHYNLALEHSLLYYHSKGQASVTLRFWKNPPSVVVGRSQFLDKEVDLDYCQRYAIVVARRITGGGAVYHDAGNLNISFFVSKELLPRGYDVPQTTLFFTKILQQSLNDFGLDEVNLEGGSNLFHLGRKISGSAGYRKGSSVLHHATLLLKANLEHLNSALLARTSNPEPKSRGSRFFPTANLPPDFEVECWQDSLTQMVSNYFGVELIETEITSEEHWLATQLCDRMYKQDSWITQQERVAEKDVLGNT